MAHSYHHYPEDSVACYLRFNPAEYHLICYTCRSHSLLGGGPSAFHRRLAGALAGEVPRLAWRLALLREKEVRLLYDHFLERDAKQALPQPRAFEGLTPAEETILAEVCVAYPLLDRFLRAWKPMLLEMLRTIEPGLAGKIDRLDTPQLEALVRQVMQGRKRSD